MDGCLLLCVGDNGGIVVGVVEVGNCCLSLEKLIRRILCVGWLLSHVKIQLSLL